MTDAFVVRGNGFFVGPQSPMHGDDQSKTNPVAAAVNNLSISQRTFDVKESLEWLLGPEEENLHCEERSAIRERRFDLLLWLLNLEPRLGNYGGDPQSAQLRRIVLIDDKQKLDLLKAASDVANRAYAPYSKINRGAAVLTVTGEVFAGCNVELASYGGSLCAEMAAVSAAVAANHRKFVAIALSPTDYPCGICRQMLVEFGIGIEIVVNEAKAPKAIPLRDLLPHHFGPDNLSA